MALRAGRLGGDSELTDEGHEFARRLKQFAREHLPLDSEPCRLWIASTKAARQNPALQPTTDHDSGIEGVRKSVLDISGNKPVCEHLVVYAQL